MINEKQKINAEVFRQLHCGSDTLLLPNAWDALSAKCLEQAGAKAIGTTSAGIAASLGYPDGQLIPKELFFSVVERIITAVDIPVSVDMEAGYATDIVELCKNVQRIIDMDAVGINIEDVIFPNANQLEDISYQVEKIQALRELIDKNSTFFFINARTDVYWLNCISADDCFDEALRRILAYQAAGADGLFIPGLYDLAIISKFIQAVNLPLNILGGAWIHSFDQIKNIGVKRVSLGSAPYRATATFIRQLAKQLIDKNIFNVFENAITYDEVNLLFENKASLKTNLKK